MALDTASTKDHAVRDEPGDVPERAPEHCRGLLRHLRRTDGPDCACRGGPGRRGRPDLPELPDQNVVDALFCEACGYDFTTGAMPRVAQPPGRRAGGPSGGRPLEWVAEV